MAWHRIPWQRDREIECQRHIASADPGVAEQVVAEDEHKISTEDLVVKRKAEKEKRQIREAHQQGTYNSRGLT